VKRATFYRLLKAGAGTFWARYHDVLYLTGCDALAVKLGAQRDTRCVDVPLAECGGVAHWRRAIVLAWVGAHDNGIAIAQATLGGMTAKTRGTVGAYLKDADREHRAILSNMKPGQLGACGKSQGYRLSVVGGQTVVIRPIASKYTFTGWQVKGHDARKQATLHVAVEQRACARMYFDKPAGFARKLEGLMDGERAYLRTGQRDALGNVLYQGHMRLDGMGLLCL
jgi:hypothetical protein